MIPESRFPCQAGSGFVFAVEQVKGVYEQVQAGEVPTDLRDLTPVIVALGGIEAVAETARPIQDVGR